MLERLVRDAPLTCGNKWFHYHDCISQIGEYSLYSDTNMITGKTGYSWSNREFLLPKMQYDFTKEVCSKFEQEGLRLIREHYDEDYGKPQPFIVKFLRKIYGIDG
mgnify:CR=1 FL=1